MTTTGRLVTISEVHDHPHEEAPAVETEPQPIVFPDDMDAECIPICTVLNGLSGIRTVESCCGHGRSPFEVFFVAQKVESLLPILRAAESITGWKIEAFWSCGKHEIVIFMLEGPIGPPDMFDGADAFMSWITDNQP